MKLVKLSLVAAFAVSSFSIANATPLEEAIKDIDVSGVLRYRYEGGSYSGGRVTEGGYSTRDIISRQDHKFRAQLNFSGAIADNFKAFVQFDYDSTDYGYYNKNGNGNLADTSTSPAVRQLYLTYTDDATSTSVIAGRQQLNTIWTDNTIDGLVGTGLKVVNTSVDGLALSAFVVDSINNDGDLSRGFTEGIPVTSGNTTTLTPIDKGNIYGAAAVGSYDLGTGQLDPQLWLAYMNNVAFFYALDLAYNTNIFDNVNWNIEGAYLGNSENARSGGSKISRDAVGNGNLFGLKGGIEVNGWDFNLGGIFYGSKKKFTLNTIEDTGNIGVLAGEEIFNTEGSILNGSLGRNTFGFLTGGYTFDETVRLGADFVYGGTKTNNQSGGKKFEAVARVDYKYSPKLNFSAFYSYMNIDTNDKNDPTRDTDHNAIRLQALYKF